MGEIIFPFRQGACIAVAQNYFAPELIEKLYLLSIDACEAIGAPGVTLGGLLPVKQTTDYSLSGWTYEGDWSLESMLELGYDIKQMDADLAAGISEIITDYTEVIPTGTDYYSDTGFLVQKYEQHRGFYLPHVDGNAAVASQRLLSIVVYLNTVEHGGETNFPRHGVAVSAQQGMAAVFPSNFAYQHEGCVPLSSDKYIINTFIEPKYDAQPDPNTQ